MYDDILKDMMGTSVRTTTSFTLDVWPWISFSLLLIGVIIVVILALVKIVPNIKKLVTEYVGESKILNGIIFLVNSLIIVKSSELIIRNIPLIQIYVDFLKGILSHITVLLGYLLWMVALCVGLVIAIVLIKIFNKE